MTHVIGHDIVNGVPYINGKRAILDQPSPEDAKVELLDGALSVWRCPECNARLGGETPICLNACHLSAAANRRFQGLLKSIAARVDDDLASSGAP